jgi:mono/diheme cytochrome c family protein
LHDEEFRNETVGDPMRTETSDRNASEPALAARQRKVVYWHRELPPLGAETFGEHVLEADSLRIPGNLGHRDDLWEGCYADLMAQAGQRLVQEILRLGGDWAHVLNESIASKHDERTGESWLHGRFSYVLYRKPETGKSEPRPPAILAVALLLVFSAMAVQAQTKGTQSQVPQSLIYSLKGPDLYRAYCASCHGLTGRGDGPVAPALKAKIPDLTLLARSNGGMFPSSRERKIISGDEVLASHGSREMPIWGPIFHQVEEDRDFGAVRLENLAKYLESIQSLGPANTTSSPSGAELYQQNCAVCHGSDLEGGTPAPSPYRTPPELTRLTRRLKGESLDAYISSVLQSGAVIPAHGLAEMPVWGTAFRLGEQLDQKQVKERIANLTAYILSRQGK